MTLSSQKELSNSATPPSSSSTSMSSSSSLAANAPAVAAAAKAKLIPSSLNSLEKAGERIRAGHLVSFPTETVYGLGCHALDPTAVNKVFAAKERPLTDPLIVHVNEALEALDLWDASSSLPATGTTTTAAATTVSSEGRRDLEKKALEALTSNFWPGPLTLVARASPKVPSIIMANTGFVACRSPSHPIARALIETSCVPIAAPSANKFGHVSPTKASHVFDDLGMEDVWIVDPDLVDNKDGGNSGDGGGVLLNSSSIVCDVGVESTVAKVEITPDGVGLISVLRHGAISSQDIASCLQKNGMGDDFKVGSKQHATKENVSNVAPGQTIRHYSPNVQSYMISFKKYNNVKEGEEMTSILNSDELLNLKSGVIIDFGGRLSFLKDECLAYRDLSPVGDSSIAAATVFDTLRWSETISGANRVYFPEIHVEEDLDDALILAVKDKLTRAASGVVVSTLI